MTPAQSLQARTAFTCILGVVVGQFLAAARATQDDNFPVLAWLAFAVTCGMVLQGELISRVQLALTAAAAPACLVATIAFLIFHRGHAFISAVEVKFVDHQAVMFLAALLWIVSYIGIFVFSFAHAYILELVKRVINVSDEVLKKIDVRLKWAAGVITSVGYIAKKFIS
jgi:hypothetical protein